MLIEDILKYACIAENTDGEGGEGGDTGEQGQVETPQTYDIDGESYTAEQIKQFRSGYDSYTQSVTDYKKLQDETKDATELYNYLKSNEELSRKLAEYDNELMGGKSNLKAPNAQDETVKNLRTELEMLKIENQISSYKAKDKNFDEPAVVELAVKNGVSIDLAYKIWKADRYEVDLQNALKEQSKSITENLSKFGNVTKTLIGEMDKGANGGDLGLSAEQLVMAENLGLTPQEYKKWL